MTFAQYFKPSSGFATIGPVGPVRRTGPAAKSMHFALLDLECASLAPVQRTGPTKDVIFFDEL